MKKATKKHRVSCSALNLKIFKARSLKKKTNIKGQITSWLSIFQKEVEF